MFVWTIVVVCACTRVHSDQRVTSGAINLLLGTEAVSFLLQKPNFGGFSERNKYGDLQRPVFIIFSRVSRDASHVSKVSGHFARFCTR